MNVNYVNGILLNKRLTEFNESKIEQISIWDAKKVTMNEYVFFLSRYFLRHIKRKHEGKNERKNKMK